MGKRLFDKPKLSKITTSVTADHKAALERIARSAGPGATKGAVLRMALDRGLPALELELRAERARDGAGPALSADQERALSALEALGKELSA